MDVRPDPAKAAQYYDRACSVGCINSCDTLGDQVVRDDPARAAALWKKSCDEGFAPACSSLSDLYEVGRGVAKDLEKAKQLFKRACTMSRDQANGCRRS